ncbi:MAG: YidC/Oxa1 family membrane protein insertase [Actinomycetota bacterium]
MIWDSLLKGLGAILSFFYNVIPSYGVAIILLTITVRLVLLPLTIRQTRSMAAMQQVQPKVKELQRKYKGNRQKLNEELAKLYKEHQVNPLGGCLPLILQLPVFFALYSVLQTPVQAVAVPVTDFQVASVSGEDVVCRPAAPPSTEGSGADEIVCEDGTGEIQSFGVTWETEAGQELDSPPPEMAFCQPREGGEGEPDGFLCQSSRGADHLPRGETLYEDVVENRAGFLGMQLTCSATQASSDVGIRQCAGPVTGAGGPALIGYYGLVALMVASTWFQQQQMQRASAGPQAQQMQLMGRIMPLFLGVISISISAGVLVYWVTTNLWQIGQQHVMLRRRSAESVGEGKTGKTGSTGSEPAKGPAPKKSAGGDGKAPKSSGQNRGGRSAGSRKKRRKR